MLKFFFLVKQDETTRKFSAVRLFQVRGKQYRYNEDEGKEKTIKVKHSLYQKEEAMAWGIIDDDGVILSLHRKEEVL